MTRLLAIGLAVLLGVFVTGSKLGAQVKSANPATTWIYAPNVTVLDLWRGVADGQVEVVSSATGPDRDGNLALVTVFRGTRGVWRCVERVDNTMVERDFACARLR